MFDEQENNAYVTHIATTKLKRTMQHKELLSKAALISRTDCTNIIIVLLASF